jgi:hypothetical protein
MLPVFGSGITVIGLFKERAVLMGEVSDASSRRRSRAPEGIKWVSADSEGVVLDSTR